MGIDRLFSRTVCINLDRRPDRWRRMEERFERHGMRTVERFAAVDGLSVPVPGSWTGQEGAYGCLRSHLAVIAEAEADGIEDLLVFEDDVELAPDLTPRFEKAFSELPTDWSFLYLGGFHRRHPIAISDALARAAYTLSTLAYAVRRPFFGELLAIDAASPEAIDTRLARLQARHVFHCLRTNLAWQDCDYSDIQGTVTNHWYIKESLAIGDTCAEEISERTALVVPLAAPAWRGTDPETVGFLVDQIREAIPGVRVLIDDRPPPSTDPADLARRAAVDFGDGLDYLLVAGSPVFFSRSHLIGAMEIARRCPVVSPFAEVVRLSRRDAARVISGRRKELDLTTYPRDRQDALGVGWGVFRLDALSGATPAGGWPIFQVPSFALDLGACTKSAAPVS